MSTKFAKPGTFFLDSPKIQKLFFFYFCALSSLWIAFVFHSPWNPDYTAGELYDTFLAWQEKGGLYFSIYEEPYRVLNYPPLYFYATKALLFLGLPALETGRLVSLCSGILSFYILYLWFRRLQISSSLSLALLSFASTSFPLLYPLPQFHLQWMAIALSLGGLYLLKAQKNLHSALGALLLVLACFTKQTQIISWAIALVWMFFQDKKKGFIFLFGSLLFFAGTALLLDRQFGAEMWKHLFTYTVGTFSWRQLGRELGMHVGPWIFFFALGIWRFKKVGFPKNDLALFYFVGQSLWLLSSAREGASYQYFMEWSLALLIWLAPLMKEKLPSLAKLAFEIQYLTGVIGVSLLLGYHVFEIKKLNSHLPKLCNQISASQTPLLADDPGLIRACGKIPALQPFIFHNLAQKKLWDESILSQKLRKQEYDLLILPFNPADGESQERWSEQNLQDMQENYAVFDFSDKLYLLRPKKDR